MKLGRKRRRLVRLNEDVLREFMNDQGLHLYIDLADKALVGGSTITNAITVGCLRETINKIENKGLGGLTEEQRARLEISDGDPQAPDAPKQYTWDDLIHGAKNVAEKIFRDNKFHADAVLTFSGPSSIFAGLVLATLSREAFMRIPVYTAIFVDKNARGSFPTFDTVPTPLFKILVPRALTTDRTRRIAVIDDTIISGVTMDKLREFFKAHYNPANVKFACCVCYEGRMLPHLTPPEIIGLFPPEPRKKFRMPWSEPFCLDSFCFEDCFLTGLTAKKVRRFLATDQGQRKYVKPSSGL